VFTAQEKLAHERRDLLCETMIDWTEKVQEELHYCSIAFAPWRFNADFRSASNPGTSRSLWSPASGLTLPRTIACIAFGRTCPLTAADLLV
jgi:hypothetical protein